MNRSVLAAAMAAAVLALSACGGDNGTPGPPPAPTATTLPTASPLPTSTVTPTVVPEPVSTATTTVPTPPARATTARPTPQASPVAPGDIGGAIGEIPGGFTLPDEFRAGDGETTEFMTTVWRAACPDEVVTLRSASTIAATRIKESVGPEHSIGNGVLMFSEESSAMAFMLELSEAMAGCVTEGPDEDGWRTVHAAGEEQFLGDRALSVRQWTQWNTGDTWVEAPGASLQLIARVNRFVVLTWEGGEFVGDPAANGDVRGQAASRIQTMVDQLKVDEEG